MSDPTIHFDPMTSTPQETRARRSIRAQLFGLTAALALPLGALLAWSSLREYRLGVEASERSTRAVADATSAVLGQYTGLTKNLMVGLAGELGAGLLDPERCSSVVRTANAVLSFQINLMSMDAEGRVVCSAAPIPAGGPFSVADREWFIRVKESSSVVLGAPRTGSITGRRVIPLAAPIFGAGGSFLGAVGGSVEVASLEELVREVQAPHGARVRLATPEGALLASVGGGRETSVGEAWIRRPVEGTDWIVSASLERGLRGEALVAAAWRGTLSFLLLAVAGLGAFRVIRGVTRSLRELAASVDDAEHGCDVPVPESAPREVAELAEHFKAALAERALARAGARRVDARYRSIVDNAATGICVSTLDGRYLEVNPAFAEMLGYGDPAELVEAGAWSLYERREDRIELLKRIEEVGGSAALETRLVRKDGHVITARLSVHAIEDEDGDRVLQVVAEDITRERRREEELRQAQKMEAIGRLAGGIAHDFNNFLTIIAGNVELMDSFLEPDDPLRGDLAHIQDATTRAGALTRQLLSFGRRQSAELRPLDVNALLRDLERMVERVIGEDVTISAELDPSVPPILADPGRLEQVVMNLVLNARDALEGGGGAITISSRYVRNGRGRPGNHGVLLTVTDDGVGMDEETRARVFEPFFTTKPKGKGTGLGLATAYSILAQHGGQITVDSSVGEGTKVDIWLPATAVVELGEEKASAPVEAPRATVDGNETVLVVEDEGPVRVLVRKILEGDGYQVLEACDGLDALELLRSLGENEGVDLVVSDVVMPRLRGPEMATRMRETHPDVPVLFISGYSEGQDISALIEESPNAYLPKPFTPSTLRSRVRSLLDVG